MLENAATVPVEKPSIWASSSIFANVSVSISSIASSKVIGLPRAFCNFCIRVASLFVASVLDSS